jgi:hypothetical protein
MLGWPSEVQGGCMVRILAPLTLLLMPLPAAAKLGVPLTPLFATPAPPAMLPHDFELPDGPPWPELGATPSMAYNGWLASTKFMGYNNETLYYNIIDQQ